MLLLGRPLFIFGVGFLMLTYALLHQYGAGVVLEKTLTELTRKETVIERNLIQSLHLKKFQKQIYVPYSRLKKQGVFQPTTADILKKRLKYLLRSSGVHRGLLKVTFIPEELPSNYPYDLRTHEVLLQFSSRNESVVYQLLKNMEKNLPGLVQVKKLNLWKRGRRKIEGIVEVRIVNLL